MGPILHFLEFGELKMRRRTVPAILLLLEQADFYHIPLLKIAAISILSDMNDLTVKSVVDAVNESVNGKPPEVLLVSGCKKGEKPNKQTSFVSPSFSNTFLCGISLEDVSFQRGVDLRDACLALTQFHRCNFGGHEHNLFYAQNSPPYSRRAMEALPKLASDFSGSCFLKTLWIDCTADKVKIHNADLSLSKWGNCRLTSCDVRNSRFHEASLGRNRTNDPCSWTGCSVVGSEFLRANFTENEFSRTNFFGCKFQGANFSGAKFDSCKFEDCSMTGVNFTNTTLTNCTFSGRCTLEQINFTCSKISNCGFPNQNFVNCIFAANRLERIDFSNFRGSLIQYLEVISSKRLHGCNFSGVDLSKKKFKGFEFDSCSFSNTNLSSTNLTHARLRACSFTNMTSAHIHGVRVAQAIITDCKVDDCDFSSAPEAIVSSTWNSCKITNTSFAECNLEHGSFNNCKFVKCSLNGAAFWHTILNNVEWDNVDATGADMRGMNLSSCRLNSCNFDAANMSNALIDPSKVESSSFQDTKLARSTFSAPGASKRTEVYRIDIVGQTIASILIRQRPILTETPPPCTPSSSTHDSVKI
eukprot:TRINITY_DN2347_c0_g1_i1.p1 TRINITY_DN2347_c0_g1~~TRINITY_DN2347_c0_g1_i1.p1  ORF type:complete len:585 (-),score=41.51 TRINITY_DN2347_c0_g1_i1:139-1893(-)